MDIHLSELNNLYERLKAEAKKDISSDYTGRLIHDLAINTLLFLSNQCALVSLISRVPRKDYFSFSRHDVPGIVCRPANASLFDLNPAVVSRQWQSWWEGTLRHSDLARMSYTIALAPCLAMELYDRQNKKQPATYFEYLIGHIFAKAVGTNPHKKACFRIEDRSLRMTMDFLFNMKNGARHIHLPVKMSTRERVVQAWAHQRLLDAAYGQAAYKGIMVLFAETKLDSRKREVIEICVPDQWFVYQALLARMERIYYFDIPSAYNELARKYPNLISVKHFGDFFKEKEVVLEL